MASCTELRQTHMGVVSYSHGIHNSSKVLEFCSSKCLSMMYHYNVIIRDPVDKVVSFVVDMVAMQLYNSSMIVLLPPPPRDGGT